MEVVRVSSGFLAQTLDVMDAAIHAPSHEDAARAVSDELAYLLRLARARGHRRVDDGPPPALEERAA